MTTPEPSANPVRPLEAESLDRILAQVLQDHGEKVAGWTKSEPGCWGFLAGKAVTACRGELGRSLAEGERRLVWHRLWVLLESLR